MARPNDTQQAGFTLVEMAIVVTIIGLLVAGVLRGQEILKNAKVNSTIQQVIAYQAATKTFFSMYKALPGDITDPGDALPNCGSAPCNNGGDGNHAIDNPSEEIGFWLHLAAAGMITGIDLNANTLNTALPKTALNSRMFAMTYNGGPATPLTGHLFWLGNVNGASALGYDGPSFTPGQAVQMDFKIDDGSPLTGIMTGVPIADSATGCVYGGLYNETIDDTVCGVAVKIFNN